MDLVLVRAYLVGLQSRITSAIAQLDGGSFLSDPWEKPPGETLQGNGITQILENGKVFERAGCGFSHVTGPKLPPSATHDGLSCLAPHLRPWVSLWCFIRATRMCQQST